MLADCFPFFPGLTMLESLQNSAVLTAPHGAGSQDWLQTPAFILCRMLQQLRHAQAQASLSSAQSHLQVPVATQLSMVTDLMVHGQVHDMADQCVAHGVSIKYGKKVLGRLERVRLVREALHAALQKYNLQSLHDAVEEARGLRRCATVVLLCCGMFCR